MRKLMVVCIILFTPISAFTQEKADAPKLEIFIGYSHLRTDFHPKPKPFFTTRFILDKGMNGWNVSVCQRVNTWLGIVADASGHYGSEFDEVGFVIMPEKNVRQYFYSFLFGPRVYVHRSDRLALYAHVLFGEARARSIQTGIDSLTAAKGSGFAIAAGGGLDVKIGSKVGIRVLEIDYLRSHLFDIKIFALTGARVQKQDNVRVSVGVVLRFGKK